MKTKVEASEFIPEIFEFNYLSMSFPNNSFQNMKMECLKEDNLMMTKLLYPQKKNGENSGKN